MRVHTFESRVWGFEFIGGVSFPQEGVLRRACVACRVVQQECIDKV